MVIMQHIPKYKVAKWSCVLRCLGAKPSVKAGKL